MSARELKRLSQAELARARDTGSEAEFWQAHEATTLGPPIRAEYRRAAPTEVLHLRLDRSAIRRLKAQAAKAGLPFATFASSVLVRESRKTTAD